MEKANGGVLVTCGLEEEEEEIVQSQFSTKIENPSKIIAPWHLDSRQQNIAAYEGGG